MWKAVVLILFFVSLLGIQFYSDRDDNIIWSDEFEGATLDTSKWTAIVGNGCPELCGFGNNEAQYYTNALDNIRITDGKLIIEAHHDSLNSSAFTSAKIISKDKGDWNSGIIEVKARLPYGKGTWPAIWMLPTLDRQLNWPKDGEIDIMEHVGYNQGWVYGTIHTEKYNHMHGTEKTDSIFVNKSSDSFHIYKIVWNTDKIEWYVDDRLYNKVQKKQEDLQDWPFDKEEYHLIINLAVGGAWGGKYGIDHSIWPQRLEVDYVRVYPI